MKRNMRFLLLFSILLSSILAAYFISGCGDDSTIIEPTPVENDTVVGTISGVVADAADGSHLANCKVVWTHAGTRDSATTDGNGYYTTGPTLSSGDYTLTFYPANSSHAAASGMTTIHSVSWHRDNNPNAAGVIIEEVPLNVELWPMTGTLSGYVFTALPTGAPGKDGQQLALDDPNNATAAANVTVTLDFGAFDIIGDTYTGTTDAEGHYSFTSVPACENANPDWVVLRTGQFTDNGIDYGNTTYSGAGGAFPITMGTIMPTIYAPVAGESQRQLADHSYVIDYSWEGIVVGYYDTLAVVFSHAMNTATTSYTFTAGSTYWWSADLMTLYILPAWLPGGGPFTINITGGSVDGRELYDTDGTAVFTRTNIVHDAAALTLVGTNLGSAGTYDAGTGHYIDFALDSNIVLLFNRDLDADHGSNHIDFEQGGSPFDFTATYDGATVTIDPDYALGEGQTYTLDFGFTSVIPGDAYEHSVDFTIVAVGTSTPPGAPTNFATTTTDVDYNDTTLALEWDIMPTATMFYVYAADNYLNPVRTEVGAFTADQAGLKQDTSITLPVAFDRYTDPGRTPFSAGTEVYVWVRAYNSAGFGPYSDSITFVDNVAPTGFITHNGNHFGSADASGSAEDLMVEIWVGSTGVEIEYVANTAPVVTFAEGGGDAAFVPSVSTWPGWDNGLQYGDGALTVTIPAGEVGAGDRVYVTISDNSGNAGMDSVRLAPYIEFTNPADTSTAMFMAPNYPVAWDLVLPEAGSSPDSLDLFISYDGGSVWDTVQINWVEGTDAQEVLGLDDTVRVADCKLGLAADGGFIFPSESFIYAGLKLTITTADSTDLVDPTLWWFDQAGTDSSAIPFSFSSIGLDQVAVVYSDDGWTTRGDSTFLVDIATPDVVTTTVVADYFPYTQSADYDCNLGITYAGGQPKDTLDWTFPVTYDLIDITAPAASSVPQAHGLFNIVWNNITGQNDSLDSFIGIDYALVDGDPTDTIWTPIVASTENYGYYAWTPIPATTPSDSVLMRFTSSIGEVLATSGLFTLQGYVMAAPTATDTLTTGDAFGIDFYQYGLFDAIYVIQYSTDGGTTWAGLDSGVANAGGDPETYTWDPITAEGTTEGMIRIFEGTSEADYDDTLAHTLSEAFVVRGFDVTSPLAADTLFEGRPATMTWTTVGTFAQVYIWLIYNADADTVSIVDQSNNVGSYDFTIPVPAATYTDARLVVYDYADSVASDFTVDLVFMTPDLDVTVPNGAEVWQMSTQHAITWTSAGNRTGEIDIEYSIDSAATWNPVVSGTEDDGTFSWDIPFISGGPYPNCFIRVTEVWSGQGTAMTDDSDARFTIQETAP